MRMLSRLALAATLSLPLTVQAATTASPLQLSTPDAWECVQGNAQFANCTNISPSPQRFYVDGKEWTAAPGQTVQVDNQEAWLSSVSYQAGEVITFDPAMVITRRR